MKPIELMQWFCRLITIKGGIVLDPFCGSGSTGCAALLEGLRFIGIEKEPDHSRTAERRISEVYEGLRC